MSRNNIRPGDTVIFRPAKWRKIDYLSGRKKVVKIDYSGKELFYQLDCGDIKLEATRFEITKIEK